MNLATKRHYSQPSRLEWVDKGLLELRRFILSVKPASVAVPALGCGLGGLSWSKVRPLIEKRLDGLETRVKVFPPKGEKL